MKTPDLTPDNPQRLAEWLTDNGIKRSWFADKVDVLPSTVTRWCAGDYPPQKRRAAKMEKLTEGAVPAAGWLK